MTTPLERADFARFFRELHGHEPFPWQERLLSRIVADRWPAVLDLPTGSGKTAVMDVVVFALALDQATGQARRVPLRVAYVVNRRLIVDDAYERARRIAAGLAGAGPGTVLARVASGLRSFSGTEAPLLARRLRGGVPREDDWARSPAQPTILCATVDQVGSRLLFRGYGVSRSMQPVHAGLLGSDALMVLDEAHLAEPFRQTLDWVRLYHGKRWQKCPATAPWRVLQLTATPGDPAGGDGFSLEAEDRAHPVLRRRITAPKPAVLREVRIPRDASREDQDARVFASAVCGELRKMLESTAGHDGGAPALGVVVNRVATARKVFSVLRESLPESVDLLLMIGPARPVDREELLPALEPVRTGRRHRLQQALVIVATQCIEAGVDIDLDGLVTEAAPLDALRQRFGRVNRDGENRRPGGAVLARSTDLRARAVDPVYGPAIRAAWDFLAGLPTDASGHLDFGIESLDAHVPEGDGELLSPRDEAPVLLPAHVDLLAQTSPRPSSEPDLTLLLHGAGREPDSVSVVWRGDLDPARQDDALGRTLLALVPPRSTEAVQLPVWAVRRWLLEGRVDGLADVPSLAAGESEASGAGGRPVFRWRGDQETSRWMGARDLRPGDVIVVPSSYGGADRYGWSPESGDPVPDVARLAAEPFAGRRFAVRVSPPLLEGRVSDEELRATLAPVLDGRWTDVRDAVAALPLPEWASADLERLDRARRRHVQVYLDVYADQDGAPVGAVFLAPFGLEGGRQDEDGTPGSTEDDLYGSLPGAPVALEQHARDVEEWARRFARACGLEPALAEDVALAAYLHDAGKADARFQGWLYSGDPLGPDPDDPAGVLAKSGRPADARARTGSGLPPGWRHEALSVRLAPLAARFAEARDPELVLFLIGAHHGHGRPFYPHEDPLDAHSRELPRVLGLPPRLGPGRGPQSLAWEWQGQDWPGLFDTLRARYGAWELARLEAMVRLADHRASEQELLAGRAAP